MVGWWGIGFDNTPCCDIDRRNEEKSLSLAAIAKCGDGELTTLRIKI